MLVPTALKPSKSLSLSIAALKFELAKKSPQNLKLNLLKQYSFHLFLLRIKILKQWKHKNIWKLFRSFDEKFKLKENLYLVFH